MKRHLLRLACITGTLALASCVNNDYDLDNVDTTAVFKVNQLSIPINLESISLSKVIALSDDGIIRDTIINGQRLYALVQKGTFASDPIKVPGFSSAAPAISPARKSFTIQKDNPSYVKAQGLNPATDGATRIAHADIPTDVRPQFTVKADNISPYVQDIDNVEVTCTMGVDLEFTEIADFVKCFHIDNLTIQLPIGLNIQSDQGTYNAEDGVFTVGDVTSTSPNSFSLDLQLLNIYDEAFDYTTNNDGTHTLLFTSEIYVKSGTLAVYDTDLNVSIDWNDPIAVAQLIASLPSEMEFVCTPRVSSLVGETFTGDVQYDVEGIDIAPIQLNNLPDILSKSTSRIILNNPQIYLNVTNPLIKEGFQVNAQTGFSIDPIWSDGSRRQQPCMPDDGRLLVMDKADNSYVLSAKDPGQGNYLDGYTTPTHIPFAALDSVIAYDGTDAKGLPQSIQVQAIDACVPRQHIDAFPLGKSIAGVRGDYTIFAPLNLKQDAFFCYEDRLTGWSSDDLNDLAIRKMSLTATIDTDVPVSLQFDVTPLVLNARGEDIEATNNGTVIHATQAVPAKANKHKVDLTIEGDLHLLDGMILKATLGGTADGGALNADQTIKLSDIHVTVDADYTTN